MEALEKAGGHDNSRGIDPLLFHASNVAAHAAVTVLVFRCPGSQGLGVGWEHMQQ